MGRPITTSQFVKGKVGGFPDRDPLNEVHVETGQKAPWRKKPTTVQEVLDRIAVDRDFLVNLIVWNNPLAVAEHVRTAFGASAETAAAWAGKDLIGFIAVMERAEQDAVVNVKWIYGVSGALMDDTMRLLAAHLEEIGPPRGEKIVQLIVMGLLMGYAAYSSAQSQADAKRAAEEDAQRQAAAAAANTSKKAAMLKKSINIALIVVVVAIIAFLIWRSGKK